LDSAAVISTWSSKSINAEKKEIAWDGSVEILAFSGPDARTIADDLQQIDSRLEDPVDPSWLSRSARALRMTFSAGHPYRSGHGGGHP
jgi:hypothetical protein